MCAYYIHISSFVCLLSSFMTTVLPSFLTISTGSIDYSPGIQPMPVVTLILDDEELSTASESQFERFWRVWYKERSFYAPKLQTLVLGLRTSKPTSAGIHRFLDYFNHDVRPQNPQVGLDMYLLGTVIPQRILRITPR